MPKNASMCSESRVPDGALRTQQDLNTEEKMAQPQREDRRGLADITGQLAALQEMKVAQLRDKYLEVFGQPSRSNNRRYLQKKIAWQIQANAEGGLSQRALDRIEELAPLAPVRWRQPLGQVDMGQGRVKVGADMSDRDPRLPAPGTVLSRIFKGEEHQATVMEDGFEYQGERYRSLSRIAREITGTNWNGFLFWGLQSRHGGGA